LMIKNCLPWPRLHPGKQTGFLTTVTNPVQIPFHISVPTHCLPHRIYHSRNSLVTVRHSKVMIASQQLKEVLDGARVIKEVFKLRSDYCALLMAVDGIPPGSSGSLNESLLQEAESSACANLVQHSVAEIPHIVAWREAYKAFGFKPKKIHNSLESLTRRAEGGLPRGPQTALTDNTTRVLFILNALEFISDDALAAAANELASAFKQLCPNVQVARRIFRSLGNPKRAICVKHSRFRVDMDACPLPPECLLLPREPAMRNLPRRERLPEVQVHDTSEGASVLLMRTAPEYSRAADPETSLKTLGSQWLYHNGQLLARVSEYFESSMACEPGLTAGLLDILVAYRIAESWSSNIMHGRSGRCGSLKA
ncbi:hypothetical protein M8818_004320, partial [Zalaria obscura]